MIVFWQYDRICNSFGSDESTWPYVFASQKRSDVRVCSCSMHDGAPVQSIAIISIMRLSNWIVGVLVVVCWFASNGHAAKILALFAFPAKSHTIMLNTIVEGLLAKGHEVGASSDER